MPKNAAYLLHELLESYVVPGNRNPQQVREFKNAHDTEAWRRHIEELHLVRNVDDILRGMANDGQDVAPFRDCIGHWYAGIGMATTPWDSKSPQNRAACDPVKMNLLHALALLIDHRGPLDVDQDEQRTLADVLDQAATLLEEDSSDMPSEVRSYLRALIDRARFVLDNLDRFGAETLRSVALELGGAMSVQAARTEHNGDTEGASRWRTAAWMLMVGFLGGAGEGAVGALGPALSEGVKQLGGS